MSRDDNTAECKRCGRWRPYHITKYSATEGCLPLCEECWKKLTPELRVPYYAALMHVWLNTSTTDVMKADALDKWPLIRAAVMEGA